MLSDSSRGRRQYKNWKLFYSINGSVSAIATQNWRRIRSALCACSSSDPVVTPEFFLAKGDCVSCVLCAGQYRLVFVRFHGLRIRSYRVSWTPLGATIFSPRQSARDGTGESL